MLKTIALPIKPALGKNNSSKSASSRNDNNKPAFERNNGNGKVDGFSVNGDGVKHAKKSKKLKGQKLAKFQKSSKSKKSKGEKSKKPLKSGNSPNFNAIKAQPSFLTPSAKEVFNRLRLTFTKAPILCHFDLKCHF